MGNQVCIIVEKIQEIILKDIEKLYINPRAKCPKNITNINLTIEAKTIKSKSSIINLTKE